MAAETGKRWSNAENPVPAWRRVGLTLKFAKDIPDDNVAPNAIVENGQKNHGLEAQTGPYRKFQPLDAPLVKRRKTNDLESRDRIGDSTHDRAQPSIEVLSTIRKAPEEAVTTSSDVKKLDSVPPQHGQNEKIVEINLKPRRKSVTFTPETKQQDGFSASTLARNWREQQQVSRSAEEIQEDLSSTEKHPEVSQTKHSTVDSAIATPKAAKRNKKKQSINEKASLDLSHQPLYLEYLSQFHQDKQKWKFSKAKQNDILKNALNTSRIPKSHEPALLGYLAGLQGAAARKRLIEDAFAVVKEVIAEDTDTGKIEEMESEKARQEAYMAALRRHLDLHKAAGSPRSEYDDQLLEGLRERLERGERAEALLAQLLLPQQHGDSTLSSSGAPQGAAPGRETARRGDQPPPRKSRKTRTQAVASSAAASSSSSSSSSSDDDESAQAAETLRPRPLPAGSLRRPHANVPAGPTHGPAATGAIPAGFGTNQTGVNRRKKIFDDDFLDAMFPETKK